MKTLTLTTRLISAAAAAATTLALFTAVAQLSEPQQSVLIARNQHRADPTLPGLPAALAQTTLAMARTGTVPTHSAR